MVLIQLMLEGIRKFESPEIYLAAGGEALVYIILTGWIITAIYDFDFFWDNPLHARLGYNNVCIGFDSGPARLVCACMYTGMAYLMLRYSWTDLDRSYYFRKQSGEQYYWFSVFTNVFHGIAIMMFAMVFVVPPSQNAWLHSIGFMALIVARWLTLLSNWAEAERCPVSSWVYLCVNGVTSVIYLIMLCLNYQHFDAHGVPLWDGRYNGFIDYFWFFQVYFTGKYIPDCQIQRLESMTWSRVDNQQTRQMLVFGTLNAPDQVPLPMQMATHKGTKRLSLLYAFAGCIFGPYARDNLGLRQHLTSWWYSQSKDNGNTAPWARRGVVHLSYKNVVAELKKREALIKSGTAKRGHDLGTTRMPRVLFEGEGGIMTSWPPEKQDVLFRWFETHSQSIAPGCADRLAEVLNCRQLLVSSDSNSALACWGVSEVARAMCGLQWTRQEASKFLAHQRTGLVLATVGYPLPSCLLRLSSGSYLEEKNKYHEAIVNKLTDIKDKWERDLIGWVVYDSLAFAGGVSVPGTLVPMVAVRMNGIVPLDTEIHRDRAAAFAYEVVRNYPPVMCTSIRRKKDLSSTRYHQEHTSLCTAGADPSVFGHRFLVRSPHFYQEHGLNFNEPAGRRFVCPGRNLALQLLAEFAVQFDPLDWRTNGSFLDDPAANMLFPQDTMTPFFLPTLLDRCHAKRVINIQREYFIDDEKSPQRRISDLGRHSARVDSQTATTQLRSEMEYYTV
eukprot:gb/GEZN01002807.1/.p1 GENE.gb/GEZN01002807.1/~~gb/GEZN01002807.1/.p1  ORF type:complete len:727 (+),score=56.51 gb/GEZN01002807.1/:104-2284(+)